MRSTKQAAAPGRESAPRPTKYVVRPPRGMSKVAKQHLLMSLCRPGPLGGVRPSGKTAGLAARQSSTEP